MSASRDAMRALPTLLRVGVAETVAYRAEFLVWMLTTTLPLVMLGLWTSVADEAPFQGFARADFVAYYLVTLVVRNLTSSWVSWQINMEIRSGALAMRLLRPIHPFVTYLATHVSAVPLRGMVALPVAVLLLVTSGRDALASDPLQLVWIVPAVVLAWLITFSIQIAIGSLAFFHEKSIAVMDLYFGLFAVLSGYLLPLPLLPGWVGEVAAVSPFRATLSIPVEIVTRRDLGAGGAAELVAFSAAWAAATLGLALLVWRRGLRRFEAVGS